MQAQHHTYLNTYRREERQNHAKKNFEMDAPNSFVLVSAFGVGDPHIRELLNI